jgi:tRNA-splicing ligase RtcB
MSYDEIQEPGGAPIKMWTRGVPVEDAARQQLLNVAKMPIVHSHIAVMPDVHWGVGATVGSVIPTKGAIIPAAVGVDIGCGMIAVRTTLTASDLPDSLKAIRSAIESAVPVGQAQHEEMDVYRSNLWKSSERYYAQICEQHPQVVAKGKSSPALQIGTLGGGNHFIELCLDEEQRVWLMLHSGSRGIGNRIGTHFISLAKEEALRNNVHLPDRDLAFLSEGSDVFHEYVRALRWAQDYAFLNRIAMRQNVITAMAASGLLPDFECTDEAINCHHNYVDREKHFGEVVWVTRKGAVSARDGELGIIPGSMGARSFIVRGKGNADSFHSCSHGAGRAMSRGQAKKRFTIEDHVLATVGVECRKDDGVIDETPGAYKRIEDVMSAQSSLVDVVHELKQILCVKG